MSDGPTDCPPTVLFLIHDLGPGGAERAYLEYLHRVTAFRTIPVLVRPRGSLISELPADRPWYHLEDGGAEGLGADAFGEDHVADPPARRTALHAGVSLLSKARRLVRIARAERAVSVSTFLHKSHTVALVAKRFHPGLSVVVNIHEQPRQHIETHFTRMRGTLMSGVYRYMWTRADGVVAVADGVREELEDHFGAPKGRIRVIPNPIDTEALRARANQGAPPPDLPSGPGPLLVAVGRLEHLKGFDLLIEAVRRVRATQPLRLALIGDGTQRSALSDQISASGLGDCVALLGHRADPIPYIAAGDLLVLSSRTEAWPTVIGEALAVGTPVLATRCSPGVVDFLCDGSCGALTDPESAEQLAGSIEDLVGRPDVLTRLSHAGLRRVEQFEPDSVIARYEATLRSASKPEPGGAQ